MHTNARTVYMAWIEAMGGGGLHGSPCTLKASTAATIAALIKASMLKMVEHSCSLRLKDRNDFITRLTRAKYGRCGEVDDLVDDLKPDDELLAKSKVLAQGVISALGEDDARPTDARIKNWSAALVLGMEACNERASMGYDVALDLDWVHLGVVNYNIRKGPAYYMAPAAC